jgi:hypothetical protein
MRRHWLWFSLPLVASIVPLAAADESEDQVEFLPEDPAAVPPDESEGQVEFLPDPTAAPPEPPSEPPPLRFEATLGGALAVPFAGQPGDTAFGFAMTYGIAWGSIPVMFGLDFVSAGGDSAGTFEAGDVDGEPLTIHTQAQSRTLYFDVWLRVQPRDWPVRPYAEGFAGARLAMLQYSLSNNQTTSEMSAWSDDEQWSSSVGWGGGVDFAGLFQIADTVSLTLGARRLHGKHVSFTLDGSVSGEKVSTEHKVVGSVTMFMLGIVAWFDLGKSS